MKKLERIHALFEYPGNVIIVDDDARFTNALSLKLVDSFTTTVFNSPHKAIEFFEAQEHSVLDELLLVSELADAELDIDGVAYVIDYAAISGLTKNRGRYQEPTVLIVDYRMPEMTGLDFLAKISNKHIKTILLTAHDEKAIAVNAFNSGLIDKYIVKDPADLDTNLLFEITLLNHVYFKEVSSYKLGHDLLMRLYDEAYNKLFAEWVKNFNIREYYRADDCGSVVGITATGKTVWLALQTADRQQSYKEIFNDHADTVFLDNNKMVYLFSEHEKNTAPITWDKFVYEIQGQITVQGIPTYYTIIQDEPFSLTINCLTSFN